MESAAGESAELFVVGADAVGEGVHGGAEGCDLVGDRGDRPVGRGVSEKMNQVAVVIPSR